MHRSLVRVLGVVLAVFGLVAVASVPAQAHTRTQRGYTQVTVAPSTLDALVSLGVSPGVVAPGKLASASPLAVRFPITGYALNNLRIKHQGGITLTAGAASIKLTDFYIDLARGRVSGIANDGARVDLFKIRGTDNFQLGLVKLVLTPEAAGALNATFGTALPEDFLFGYATPRPFARF